jgi:hypothetical protein
VSPLDDPTAPHSQDTEYSSATRSQLAQNVRARAREANGCALCEQRLEMGTALVAELERRGLLPACRCERLSPRVPVTEATGARSATSTSEQNYEFFSGLESRTSTGRCQRLVSARAARGTLDDGCCSTPRPRGTLDLDAEARGDHTSRFGIEAARAVEFLLNDLARARSKKIDVPPHRPRIGHLTSVAAGADIRPNASTQRT